MTEYCAFIQIYATEVSVKITGKCPGLNQGITEHELIKVLKLCMVGVFMDVCVCVCERERERGRKINVSTTDLSESKKLKLIFILFFLVVFISQIHSGIIFK